MVFCFIHFNSNRCFRSFLGKFNTITGNSGKFLEKEKNFILDFQLGSEYPYAESCIFRSIYPDGISKDTFSQRFFKISTFQRSYRPKTRLLRGCYTLQSSFY